MTSKHQLKYTVMPASKDLEQFSPRMEGLWHSGHDSWPMQKHVLRKQKRKFCPLSMPARNGTIASLEKMSRKCTSTSGMFATRTWTVQTLIPSGWPDKRNDVPMEIQQCWDSRDDLAAFGDVIFKGPQIVILPRKRMLTLINLTWVL